MCRLFEGRRWLDATHAGDGPEVGSHEPLRCPTKHFWRCALPGLADGQVSPRREAGCSGVLRRRAGDREARTCLPQSRCGRVRVRRARDLRTSANCGAGGSSRKWEERSMKDACLFLSLVVSVLVVGSFAQSIPETTHPQISALQIDPQSVTVLRLRSGYASSVRLPEEVSSVMIGNPASFKAEHSEAEPRMVFIKPTTSQPAQSNALITTKSGQEVSLHLVSTGRSAGGQAVDFLLEYTRPRSLLVEPSAASSFPIADRGGGDREQGTSAPQTNTSAAPP